MANYNTFALIDTRRRKMLLNTSSARKCRKQFVKGYRIEVWNNNTLVEVIYDRNIADMNKYVSMEKEYISRKQKRATERNKMRKAGDAKWQKTSLQL